MGGREEGDLVDRPRVRERGPGWATVFVAMFRGARVAAKCVHAEIISHHNIQLFRREMDIWPPEYATPTCYSSLEPPM